MLIDKVIQISRRLSVCELVPELNLNVINVNVMLYNNLGFSKVNKYTTGDKTFVTRARASVASYFYSSESPVSEEGGKLFESYMTLPITLT
jgi:hypothetical protein